MQKYCNALLDLLSQFNEDIVKNTQKLRYIARCFVAIHFRITICVAKLLHCPICTIQTILKKAAYNLYDAAWIDDEGKYIDLKIHGLFLVKKDNIESVEFALIDKSSATEDKGGNINEQ